MSSYELAAKGQLLRCFTLSYGQPVACYSRAAEIEEAAKTSTKTEESPVKCLPEAIGEEAENVLDWRLWHSLILASLVGIVTLLQAYVLTAMIPKS